MRAAVTLLSQHLTFRTLPRLADSSLATFRKEAFSPEKPCLLPAGALSSSLPAITSWFRHASSPESDSSVSSTTGTTGLTTLRETALDAFSSTMVTTELSSDGAFTRHAAPLGIWIAWARHACLSSEPLPPKQKLTIAQASLASLPAAMRAAVPTPTLVQHAGQGDVYDASLWLGVAPTVTPLHRDPNPNVLAQLAGRKRVRLLDPARGRAVWESINRRSVEEEGQEGRGQEGQEGMMVGERREGLERAMWTAEWDARLVGDDAEDCDGWQGEIAPGDAIFIPTGWWHAVHGIGVGVTASVCRLAWRRGG